MNKFPVQFLEDFSVQLLLVWSVKLLEKKNPLELIRKFLVVFEEVLREIPRETLVEFIKGFHAKAPSGTSRGVLSRISR